ncbi:uncharacterized protein BDV14DRAFT_136919 [Aspergillus stella-maris]|uniref:uncharacterized protein n=1 Tax=Aspergillus stella-maris TaxID=1810926 RepID=UPI003CCC903A
MASIASQQPLTKHNLAIHEQLLQAQNTATDEIALWVDKVILEEQTHLFCSQMGTTLSAMHLEAEPTTKTTEYKTDQLSEQCQIPSTTTSTDFKPLKIFEQQQRFLMYPESPLERFFTPGSSDPSYFSRTTLAHVGLQFGSMESRKERVDMAKGHVEAAKENAFRAQSPEGR